MIMGALGANWGEAPQVVRNKSWPAFKQTGEGSLLPCPPSLGICHRHVLLLG